MLDFQKIKPLQDQVLIKRNREKTIIGNILLPEASKEKPKEGIVVATGLGKKDQYGKVQPVNVKKGDHVLFQAYAGLEFTSEEEEYILLSEEEIFGIIS